MMHIPLQNASPHHLLHFSHGDYTFSTRSVSHWAWLRTSMVSPTILSRPEISHLNTPRVSPGLQHVTNKAVVKLYHRKPSEHLYHCLNTSHFGSHIVPSMAAKMQPRTQVYVLAEDIANLALQPLRKQPITDNKFPGIGPRDKASQHVLLPLDCGVHEKSTRACPMMQVMSMLPTSLFFKLTCWK